MDSPLVTSLQHLLDTASRSMAAGRLKRKAIIFCIWIAALAIAVCIAGLLAAPLPGWAAWAIWTAGAGILLAGIINAIIILAKKPNHFQTARLIETTQPQLGNSLINTLQLGRDSSPLAQKAIAESAAPIHSQDILKSLQKDSRARLIKPALLFAGLLPPLIIILIASANSREALSSCLLPWQKPATSNALTKNKFDPLKNVSLQLQITPPEYTKRKPQSVPLQDAPQTIKCLAGSVLRFVPQTNDNIAMQAVSRQSGMLPMDTAFSADKNTDFQIEINEASTHKLLACWPASGSHCLRILPDNGPQVRITKPVGTATVHPGMKLPVTIISNDDIGLGEVQVFLKNGENKPSLIKSIPLKGKTKATSKVTLELYNYTPPQELTLYATVTDTRPHKTATSQSNVLKIKLEMPKNLAQTQERMLQNFRRQMQNLLEKQARLRVNTDALLKSTNISMFRKSADRLYTGQSSVQGELGNLIELAGQVPSTGELQETAAVLASLHCGPAKIAIEQTDILRKIKSPGNISPAAGPLKKTQNEIIDTLQKLLGILPYATAKMGQPAMKQSDELTSQQKKEFTNKLAKQLEKFNAQQQKVVQALGALAAKNADDFSKTDLESLKELGSTEDRLEKFLEAAISDLSTMAKQDFGNPSLLEELISIHTDVTMAKDALAKKASEVATLAASDSLAKGEELKTNLEQTDDTRNTPDRLKINMENPSEFINKEQPELAGELEDVIGDLLEKEDELFDDMEDLSSNNPGAGIKGVAWEDGPQTSMDALGVTGNVLPNNNEISGRSGEGRTAKSSGEFVQNNAVGKGGRRTATRLGNEAFQEGEINDTSQDSAGGATGGGKISSAGQEGLEGPTPAQLNNALKRLTEKQAELIARSHKISQKYSPGSYANYKLRESVILMNKVHSELKAGRYKNALRYRQETIDAIRSTHDMTADPMKITRDSSTELPKEIQDNIANSAGSKLPPEYSNVLQKYFQRLAENAEK